MIARGQTVGAVLLGRAGTTPRAGDEDARVAEELGRRIGVAVDNARLYHSAELARRVLEFLFRARWDEGLRFGS